MKIDFNIQKLIEERIGKITPVKVFLGLAFFIIAVNLLGLILGIFQALLPFAVIAVVGYYGYQFLQSSRGQELLQNARKTAEQSAPVIQGETVKTKAQTSDKQTVERVESAATRLEDIATGEAGTETDAAEESPASRLTVPEKVNPETGLAEPDLERLMEKEQQKLNEANKVNDNVLAQLEARKKRLKGGG